MFNGVNLLDERTGSGEPMVMVHGSWGDHHNWSAVAPLLSQSFEVITFDGRGQTPGTLRSVVVHEPPLLDLLKGRTEFQSTLDSLNERIRAVIALLEVGDNAAAAERFVDTLAFGPGARDNLPPPIRETIIRNAPTFLEETRDPDGQTVDVDSLCRFDRHALVSIGTQSPPFFKPIVQTVAAALSMSTLRSFDAASHVPHISHADLYVATMRNFCHAKFLPGIGSRRR